MPPVYVDHVNSEILKGSLVELQLPPSGSFIYFLFQDDDLVYIGQTRSLDSVVSRHRLQRTSRPWEGIFPKKFNKLLYRHCPSEDLDPTEEACIVHFKPIYNKAVFRRKISAEAAEQRVRQFLINE